MKPVRSYNRKRRRRIPKWKYADKRIMEIHLKAYFEESPFIKYYRDLMKQMEERIFQ